ncbi:hypothetical protein Tco_1239711, partial [Tanacetum coccineum]
MLAYDLPCCYVDGVTYGVPWFAESVEKKMVAEHESLLCNSNSKATVKDR